MIRVHIDKEKAVPLWAAIGAPLVGVPLMVALLSLAAPAETAPPGEPDAGIKTEQVEGSTPVERISVGCPPRMCRSTLS